MTARPPKSNVHPRSASTRYELTFESPQSWHDPVLICNRESAQTCRVMAWTLKAKIEAEHRMRELLASEGMPEPDAVEYGYTCVRFFFHESKTCVEIDLDPPAGDSDSLSA